MIWREVLFHRPSPHQWSVIWALWITDNSSVQTHRSNASSNPEEDILSRNQEMSHCFSSLVHNFYIRGLFFLMLCLSHDIFIFFLLNFLDDIFLTVNSRLEWWIVCVCARLSLQFVLCLLFCGQALEEYGTQESSEQNISEMEAKTEAARQNLRKAEVLTP